MNSESSVCIARYRLEKGFAITLLASLTYFLVIFGLCVFRYHTFQYHDWDFANFAYAMWGIIHGGHYSLLSGHFLGNHFSLIAYLIAPIYFVFRHPLTLIFLQSFFLSFTSIPIYSFARRKFDWPIAVCFVVMYLCYPSLYYVNMNDFHFETLAPFFLTFAFYFLIINNRRGFFAAAAVAVLCKENISAIIAAMGLYAVLFRPHRRKFGVVVFLISSLYFVAVTLYLQPLFITKGTGGYAEQYSAYGSGFGSIFKFILLNPIAVCRDFFSNGTNWMYLKNVFAPVSYLSLIRPDILLIVLPTFLKNGLSNSIAGRMIYWHYQVTLIPFIIVSSIFAFKKLMKIRVIRKAALFILSAIILIEIALGIKSYENRPFTVDFSFKGRANDKLKREALRMIPPNTGVVATFGFLPHLSHRRYLGAVHALYSYPSKIGKPIEYGLIDFNDSFLKDHSVDGPKKKSEALAKILLNPEWGVDYAKGDVVLFRRGRGTMNRILEITESLDAKKHKQPLLTVDGSLQLLDLKRKYVPSDEYIHLTFFWALNGPSSSVYDVYFYVSDGRGEKFLARHPLGYRFYTPSLGTGKILKEDYWLMLPKGEKRSISMRFFDTINRRVADVTGVQGSRDKFTLDLSKDDFATKGGD